MDVHETGPKHSTIAMSVRRGTSAPSKAARPGTLCGPAISLATSGSYGYAAMHDRFARVSMNGGGEGRGGDIIAHLYVHTDDGAIYDFKLKVWKEFDFGGTFVDTTGQSIMSILKRNNVSMIRMIGEHYLVFTIEEPGELRKLLDFSADSDPLTLDANYGIKVKIAPYDRRGLKFDVTK